MKWPSLRAWGIVAGGIASASVAVVTLLTVLETQLAWQLVASAAVAALIVGAVALQLGRAGLGRERRRDAAFAEVIREGNALVSRCRGFRPEEYDRDAWFAVLDAEWKRWDASGWALVKEWGSEADVETYSRENPTNGLDRSKIAENVVARLDRLERILRAN